MIVTLEGVTKRFDRDVVFEGLTCQLEVSGITTLTGPNGVGKTVLCRMLAGLDTADAGTVSFDDTPTPLSYGRRAARLRGIEYVPQHTALAPGGSYGELFARSAYGGTWFRHKHIEDALFRIATQYALAVPSRPFDVDVWTLSSLERLDLFLARALATKPRLLVLDEPSATLGTDDALAFGRTLRRLGQEGLAVLVVSHPYQRIASDRQYVMRRLGAVEPTSPTSDWPAPFPALEPVRVVPVQWSASICIRDCQVPLHPGLAVLVECPSSEFASVADSTCESARLDRTDGGTEPLRLAIVCRDAGERQGARELTLAENALVGRWTDDFWRARLFRRHVPGVVSRHALRNRLVPSIAKAMGVHPSEPERSLRTLSGGNRQRFMIGRAAGVDCDVLLAVNLFHGLDDPGIERTLRLLNRRRGHGMAVVFLSSHPGVELEVSSVHYRVR